MSMSISIGEEDIADEIVHGNLSLLEIINDVARNFDDPEEFFTHLKLGVIDVQDVGYKPEAAALFNALKPCLDSLLDALGGDAS